jgi:hypothetical protein
MGLYVMSMIILFHLVREGKLKSATAKFCRLALIDSKVINNQVYKNLKIVAD